MKLRNLVPAVVLLGLAGCMVGPDYHTPEAASAEAWRHNDGWQPVPEQPWLAQGRWWEAFEDATLTALVDQATGANQTLAQAEARYRGAEAALRQAGAAGRPAVDGTVATTRGGTSGEGAAWDSRASLAVRWMPDLWGQVRRQVEAGTAQRDASAAELAGARLAVQLAVADAYVQLRSLDQEQALLEASLAAYAKSVSLTERQYQAGVAARSDVIQAQTQRQSLQTQVHDLARRRAAQEAALAVLLGDVPSAFSLAAAEQLPVLPSLPPSLPAVLIARRPDVVAAERQVAAANARIGVAQAAWLPNLTLNASGALVGERIEDLFNAPARVWSLGPSLAQTLFDGGLRRAQKETALADYDAQVAGYRQAVLEGLRDVETALAEVALLRRKADDQAALVTLAEDNERVVNRRYASGLVSFIEVASAQTTTLDARRSALALERDQLLASLTLAAALGGGWDLDDPVVQHIIAPSAALMDRHKAK